MTTSEGISSDDWATPQWLFDQLNAIYGPFLLDACASQSNAKCKLYYDKFKNGLDRPWASKTWLNPPFSKPGPWLEKAIMETKHGNLTGALLPADHSTKWYQKFIATQTRVIIAERFPWRIKFDPPKGWEKKQMGAAGCHIFVLFTPEIYRYGTQLIIPPGR